MVSLRLCLVVKIPFPSQKRHLTWNIANCSTCFHSLFVYDLEKKDKGNIHFYLRIIFLPMICTKFVALIIHRNNSAVEISNESSIIYEEV